MEYHGNIFHVSTAKVYGMYTEQSMEIGRINENYPCNPVGVKATSRYIQEQVISGLGKDYGIPYIILRLGTLWGSFTDPATSINAWIRDVLLKRNLKLCGNGEKDSRDFVHVYDVCQVIKDLVEYTLEPQGLDDGELNEIYNIGGNPLHEIFMKNLSESVKKMLRPWHPRVTTEHIDYFNEPEEMYYREFLDCSKARKKLGYLPYKPFIATKIFQELVPWIGKYECGFGNPELLDLERLVGIMNPERERAVLLEKGYPDPIATDVAGGIAATRQMQAENQLTRDQKELLDSLAVKNYPQMYKINDDKDLKEKNDKKEAMRKKRKEREEEKKLKEIAAAAGN